MTSDYLTKPLRTEEQYRLQRTEACKSWIKHYLALLDETTEPLVKQGLLTRIDAENRKLKELRNA